MAAELRGPNDEAWTDIVAEGYSIRRDYSGRLGSYCSDRDESGAYHEQVARYHFTRPSEEGEEEEEEEKNEGSQVSSSSGRQ